MKILRILFSVLRYRVALMLYIFFLFGLVMHVKIEVFKIEYLFALIVLALSYVAATTVNDIVDLKVDRINHPKGIDRPLVSGKASKKDMVYFHMLSSFGAIIFSFFLGIRELMLTLSALAVNYIYSVPPLQISYKTYLAPLLLSIAYVIIPYTLGVLVSGGQPGKADLDLLVILLLLFCGRIVLKDFRDRKGDAKFGKPTLVLKYGKTVTVLISFIFVSAGNILMILFLNNLNIIYSFFVQLFFLGIYFLLYKLYKAEDVDRELVTIGIGSKIANGLLLTVLGILLLTGLEAPAIQIEIFLSFMSVFYFFAVQSMLMGNVQKDTAKS